MSQSKNDGASNVQLNVMGLLAEKGVKIREKQSADQLSSRGYGVAEKDGSLLNFCEALYLVDRGMLEVKDKKGGKLDFRQLLQHHEKSNDNAWSEYLVYRDLRSRGYVVREGFGSGVDFRAYDRGEYAKDAARYLIVNIQEGKPTPIAELTNALTQSISLKKELVLAVVNRRGEIVYYSVSQLTLP